MIYAIPYHVQKLKLLYLIPSTLSIASILLLSLFSIQPSYAQTSIQNQSQFEPLQSNGTSVSGNQSDNLGANASVASSTPVSTSIHSLADIFRKVDDSVVQITRSVAQATTQPLNPLQVNVTALGSGIVYDSLGHIVTNNHVLAESNFAEVTFTDGNRYLATVVGRDSYNDITVLKIMDNFTSQEIIPISFGNSSNLEVGQEVVAIGNPFGLSNTMTQGIISFTGRFFSIPESGIAVPNAIQTDAAVNPGNSGGPLLNTRGEMIGMNIGGYISFQGGSFSANFAIPSNTVQRIVPELIEKGTYEHPWLGFTGVSLTSDLAILADLDRNSRGVLVNNIIKGGPADKAGLQGATIDHYQEMHVGDIVVSVDNQTVSKIDDIILYIEENKSIGDKLLINVLRDGKPLEITMSIEQRPDVPF